MDQDLQVLAVLLGVKTLGGDSLAKNDQLFKGMKAATARASQQRLLQDSTRKTLVSARGKTKEKSVAVLEITASGEDYLRQFANPDSLQSAKVGELHAFRAELQSSRLALRDELLAAVKSKTKASTATPNLEQVFKRLTATLEKLVTQVTALEKSVPQQSEDPVLVRIDHAFEKLLARIGSQTTDSRGQTAATPVPAQPPSLKVVLQAAYEKLCRFIEFEDGLVEIPRLYHESRKTIPNLSVELFHQELDQLWSRRELELKILNEVRTAKEPDKGIWRNDCLYYFVYWRQP